jgi:hypothetical protein
MTAQTVMAAQTVPDSPSAPDETVRIVEWVPLAPTPARQPVPVLAPYLGMLGSALCALTGSWLLLAPYALDYRHGAVAVPRATVVDLATGAAAVVLGLATAALFGAALVRRLRAAKAPAAAPGPDRESIPMPQAHAAGPDGDEAFDAAGSDTRGAEAGSAHPPTASGRAAADGASARPVTDPADTLRELLTPLVAALAADLRGRDAYPADPPDSAASGDASSASGSTGPTPDTAPDRAGQDPYPQAPRYPSQQAQDPRPPLPDEQSPKPPHRLPRTPPPRSEW